MLLDSSPDAVLVCHKDGTIHTINRMAEEWLGKSADQLQGANLASVFGPVHSHLLYRLLTRAVRTRAEFLFQRCNGAIQQVELLVLPFKSLVPLPLPDLFLVTLRPLSGMEASLDSLTGLPNRILFLSRAQAIMEQAAPQAGAFGVLVINIEEFSVIHDSLGPARADQVLAQYARRLSSVVGQDAVLGRMNGDEFALFVPGLGEGSAALGIAQRIQTAMAQSLTLDRGEELFLSCRVGIAIGKPAGKSTVQLLHDATIAVHRAREKGRGRCEVFNSSMFEQAVHTLQMQNDLRRAIEQNEFLIYYQPILSLKDQEMVGVEAVVRWQHSVRGLLEPADFLAVAEQAGLMVPIGQEVFRQACRHVRKWHLMSGGKRKLQLHFNLSPVEFAHPGLLQMIGSVLQETRIDPTCVQIELTEDIVLEPNPAVMRTLLALKALGVGLQLDDFGTKHSCFGNLHRFPISTLKIDRSFISRLETDDNAHEIVKTIVSLAHRIGMDVIAEGVERPEQLALLGSLSCNYVQGFFFSAPLDGLAIESWVKN